MSDTALMQPETTVSGLVVGCAASPYDFIPQGGNEADRSAGISYRVWIASGDSGTDNFTVRSIKIAQKIGPAIASGIAPGDVVSVYCTGYAKPRQGGRSAVIEWTAKRVSDENGEILADCV